MMEKNKEIEIKILMSEEDVAKLPSLSCIAPYLRQDSVATHTLISSYYDTAELTFKKRGIAYRVRDKGDGTYEATVKTSIAREGGFSERLELNIPLPDEQPVLTGFAELGLDCNLQDLAPEGIRELFTVKVERTTYLLDLPTACVEVAIDNGAIIAGDKRDPISEVELELKEGSVDGLFLLRDKLAQEIRIKGEERSKFARGLALVGLLDK